MSRKFKYGYIDLKNAKITDIQIYHNYFCDSKIPIFRGIKDF